MRVECEFEADVLAAVMQSRWPERTDAELRAHVESCSICGDVAAVAGHFDAVRESAFSCVSVPDSGRVWWMAQLRARREAVKTAARPITVVEAISVASAVGLLGACFGATSEWFQAIVRSAKLSFAGWDLAGPFAEHSLLAMAIAAFLVLAPVAAWLAIRKE